MTGLRRRLLVLVVLAATSLVTTVMVVGPASARPLCPPPLVWDPVEQECVPRTPPPPPPPPPPPQASFTWRLQQLQANPIGGVEETNYDTTDELDHSLVELNACSSFAAGGIAAYRWSFYGRPDIVSPTGCAMNWFRPLSQTYATVTVRLTIVPRNPAFGPTSTTQVIRYRDIVIASIGDSAASGEGVPLAPNQSGVGQIGGPYPQAPYCDRSGFAASALAALHVQQTSPDTTVHFWHLACSGARITAADGWPDRFTSLQEGGLLDPYAGTHNTVNLVPQVDRLQQLISQLGPLMTVDRLIMTVGANDIHWATVLSDCFTSSLLPGSVPKQLECLLKRQDKVVGAENALPSHFAALGARLSAVVPANRVYLTGYWDPIDSLLPQPEVCGGELLASLALRQWGRDVVEQPLQAAVAQAAVDNHWNYVAGVPEDFQGHGVCQVLNRWINSASDSLAFQGDTFGTWHANLAGQQAIALRIEDAIGSLAG